MPTAIATAAVPDALLGTSTAYLLGVNHTDGTRWVQHVLHNASAAAGIVVHERRSATR